MREKVKSGTLSKATKLGFGAADLGGNLFFTAMGFWTLNYLTDTVGLGAAAAGAAVFFFPAAFCDRTRPGFVCGF